MRALVVMSLLLLAGCAETATPDEPEEAGILIDAERPETTYGDVTTGPGVEPDWNATTEAAPKLVPGEWWRIRFDITAPGLEDTLVEVVRVVANVTDDGYLMGMPHEGWLKEAISFHAPGFGDIATDLSYMTHNERFEPVRFPLSLGATWETSLAAQPYEAEVIQADAHTATIHFESITAEPGPVDPVLVALGILPGASSMEITYDARQHEVVRMESPLGTWEVVEHGYDYEGWVTVPRAQDTAIDYGVFLTASDTHTPLERTIEVPEDLNRMTMMHFVGTLNEAPAYLRARDVTPAGAEHISEMTGAGFRLSFYEVADPGGTWTTQDTVVGAGFTYHMGIAYFQYDIHLPDGLRRADHGHAVLR